MKKDIKYHPEGTWVANICWIIRTLLVIAFLVSLKYLQLKNQ
jgi:uncharacterized membrane protein